VQPIRRHITEILKERGSATVAELAEHLGMAQVSVRHHLDILIGEDLVLPAGVRRRDGAGRPSQIYALAPAAAKLFPQRHDMLAGDLLVQLKTLMPASQVRSILLRIGEKWADEAPRSLPDQPLEQRLDEVTEFLTEKGYNARWELRDGRYEIHACNCPYIGVADHHPELCMMDQAMIQHLLPDAARRESRALNGASHCTYVIELETEKPPYDPGHLD
jgi:predicted ArsR family transcriptional regulator